MTSYNGFKLKTFLCLVIYFIAISFVYSESTISVLWSKEIEQDGRSLKPYTIKVTDDNILRVIGLSYIPKREDPKLIEYKIDLNTDELSEIKTLLPMNEEDITILLPEAAIKDARLIDDSIIIIRNQYNSYDFQELTISNDDNVKVREISGLTRNSVSTHGACRDLTGNIFLCGNSGYIRKVGSDGNVAWDTNYKSNKGEDGTLDVTYSKSEKVLVAFGMSFEPDTKFTSKDSSLWLANVNSEGDFVAKTEFEGITNFGKNPSFCLSQSDHPIVIYDLESELKSYNVVVSKFSKDLKNKEWTTPLFQKKDVMVSQMALIPFGDDLILSALLCLSQHGVNPYFYILDKNGNIINRAVFEDISCAGLSLAVAQDKIFLVTEDRRHKKEAPTNFLRLICFKINNEGNVRSDIVQEELNSVGPHPKPWYISPQYQHYNMTATDCEKCIDQCLKELRSIKPGMTRQEVMLKLLTDGGIQTSTPVRFLHPQCRRIKVDINFSLTKDDKSKRQMWEPDDKVISVSKPYLEYMFTD